MNLFSRTGNVNWPLVVVVRSLLTELRVLTQ
jgi:hypothetical protein